MPRPARFSLEQIVAATTRLVATCGPDNATIARVAGALRAPTGSIYHRISSRDELLGEVWLRAAASFQDGFFERLAGPLPRDAGLDAVRYVPQWGRDQPQEARILLLHRREDFLGRGWPSAMTSRAKALGQQVDKGLQSFCDRLFGRTDAVTLRIAAFALAEAPIAAVRRHIELSEPPPPTVDALVVATFIATIALGGAKP